MDTRIVYVTPSPIFVVTEVHLEEPLQHMI